MTADKFTPRTRWSDGRYSTTDSRRRIAKLLRAYRQQRGAFILARVRHEPGTTYAVTLVTGGPIYLIQTKG